MPEGRAFRPATHPCHNKRIPLVMANPRRDDRDRDPKAGGNNAAKGGSWRDRFPGWETFQGRVHDPRAERNIDPTKDVRYDTNLKPSSIVHKQGLVFWVLLATIGIVLLVLAGYAMYYKFQVPSRRS